jgi:hypothetical protein
MKILDFVDLVESVVIIMKLQLIFVVLKIAMHVRMLYALHLIMIAMKLVNVWVVLALILL